MYSFNSHIVEKSTRSIIDNMDDKFEDFDDKFTDIDNKLQTIENLLNVKLEVCYKRVNDVYSMQNKVNEINKMNNQSINRQINQYDEEIEDADINQKQAIYNSLETSMSPHSKFDKLNNQCFIKHCNTKNPERDMFYMSSLNKNEMQSKNKTEISNTSETSNEPEQVKIKTNYLNNKDLCSTSTSSSKTSNTKTDNKKSEKSDKTSKTSNTNKKSENDDNNIFANLYKNNKKSNIRIVKDNISLENESNLEEFINSLPDDVVEHFFQKNKININSTDINASVILEMNGDVVKPYKVETSSPKFVNAMKILNETNFIKNNSYNKLNELNEKQLNSETSTKSDNTYSENDKSENLDINDFGNTIKITNIMDLDGNNFIYSGTSKKQVNDKIVELNE